MDDLSDEVLMARIQAGELSLLGLLARRYERGLFSLAMRLLGRREAAEDAFQDTFLKLFQQRARYRPGARFRPWLYQICLNLCRDQLRRQQRRPTADLEDEVADGGPSVEEAAEKARLSRLVAQAVGAMPERQREVFVLAFYQQLPYPEVAAILNLPVGTVKSRMYHASRWLAERLQGH
jgi:RNA polymerase sigma-70 factor (ECF subfamily)